MKKIIILMFLLTFVTFTTGLSAEETTEVVQESPEPLEILRAVLFVSGSLGFSFLGFASFTARKKIKEIGTVEFFSNLIIKGLEKFGSLPQETKNKVDFGLKALASLPFAKSMIDKVDTTLEQRLLDIEDKISNWKIKINSGLLEKEDLTTAQKQIQFLQEQKNKIQNELTVDEENGS